MHKTKSSDAGHHLQGWAGYTSQSSTMCGLRCNVSTNKILDLFRMSRPDYVYTKAGVLGSGPVPFYSGASLQYLLMSILVMPALIITFSRLPLLDAFV